MCRVELGLPGKGKDEDGRGSGAVRLCGSGKRVNGHPTSHLLLYTEGTSQKGAGIKLTDRLAP